MIIIIKSDHDNKKKWCSHANQSHFLIFLNDHDTLNVNDLDTLNGDYKKIIIEYNCISSTGGAVACVLGNM